MTRSTLSVLLALVGLAACDVPWPPAGKLPFPGYPAVTDGAWFANAPEPSQPQFTVIHSGDAVSARVYPDGSLRTTVIKITSYECLESGPDASTVRYMWTANATTDGGAANATLNCAVARLNATHRALVNYGEAEGKCPDADSLAATAAGFDASSTTGVIKTQIYERVDGVMSGPLVLQCKNSTTPLPVPTETIAADPTLGTKPPADLGSPGGATTPTGVWIAEGTMEIITPRGYVTALAADRAPYAVSGNFLTSACVDPTTYLAANSLSIRFNNGTEARGYHCERGVRAGDTLALSFTPGPDCAALATADGPPDVELKLHKAIPGIDTECGAAAPAPAPAPPASAAVRTALGSAVAAAVAAALM